MTAGQEEDVFDVRGDVALVTGAASGLGLAFAEALAERGAHVTLADVDADVLSASTQALADRGLHARAEVVDVTDADAVQAAVDRVVETEGRLDVVFANAGIGAVPGYAFEGGQTLDAIRSEDLDRVLDVNLHGMLHTIGSAAGVMKSQRSGRIVVTSSIAGRPAGAVRLLRLHLQQGRDREHRPARGAGARALRDHRERDRPRAREGHPDRRRRDARPDGGGRGRMGEDDPHRPHGIAERAQGSRLAARIEGVELPHGADARHRRRRDARRTGGTELMVETVRGPVAPEDLGTSLLHEHVFIASPEGIANFNHHWGAPWWDEEERVAAAIADLQELRDLGVRTIVDPTGFGLSRDIHRLQRVNAEVDINIVVCTGLYAFIEVPGYLKYRPAEDLAAIFGREIEVGIDDTGVKAAFLKCAVESYGIVGDIPLILDATALTSVATGAPIMVHTNAEAKTGTLALKELTKRGVDPTRIVIAHASDSNDMDYLREIADSGAILGFDRFNIPNFNSDENRIEMLLKCLDEGYIDRIHLSHDAATFNDFMQHNPPFDDENPSYTHIHREILPKLLERGVTQEQIDEMLVTNARRFLAPDPSSYGSGKSPLRLRRDPAERGEDLDRALLGHAGLGRGDGERSDDAAARRALHDADGGDPRLGLAAVARVPEPADLLDLVEELRACREMPVAPLVGEHLVQLGLVELRQQRLASGRRVHGIGDADARGRAQRVRALDALGEAAVDALAHDEVRRLPELGDELLEERADVGADVDLAQGGQPDLREHRPDAVGAVRPLLDDAVAVQHREEPVRRGAGDAELRAGLRDPDLLPVAQDHQQPQRVLDGADRMRRLGGRGLEHWRRIVRSTAEFHLALHVLLCEQCRA